MTRQKRALWLLLAVAIAWLDLWSKGLWVYPRLDPPGPPQLQEVWVQDWVYIRTIWNQGAVWSIDLAKSFLKWATLLAVPAIVLWMFWSQKARRRDTAAQALILGGAIGNLYDRFRFGAVRDFIDVSFGNVKGWHWPTFNVADIALVVGIGMLLLFSFKSEGARG